MVVFFSLIPYIGIIICWVPAVLIATLQFGDMQHPVLVSGIFLLSNNSRALSWPRAWSVKPSACIRLP